MPRVKLIGLVIRQVINILRTALHCTCHYSVSNAVGYLLKHICYVAVLLNSHSLSIETNIALTRDSVRSILLNTSANTLRNNHTKNKTAMKATSRYFVDHTTLV